MRKYQQLFLLLISFLSVCILLMYKSENNRLKYVLKYVNFFSRNDAAVLRRLDGGIGNRTMDEDKMFHLAMSRPLPVWQLIGSGGDFYAYSSYWKRNELMAGGQAHVLVVGRKGAVVDFRCSLDMVNGRQVQGKFRFQRDDGQNHDTEGAFTSYHFFCQVSRDFGQPEIVSFMDAGTKNPVKLRLRHMKTEKKSLRLLPAIVCVDLVDYNMNSTFARREDALLQFFLIHQALGVDYFVVYNYDELPLQLIHILQRANIHLNGLPFNFPFTRQPSSNLTHQLIETDCQMRSFNYASFSILMKPNEIIYPSARFVDNDGKRSLHEQLRHYDATETRFELATFNVCFDERKKLLMDHVQYDPELKTNYKMLLHRLELPPPASMATNRQVELALSKGLVHRYVDCLKVGEDGLHDWRNGIREDFMQHIDTLRNEVDLLI
ncbi:uncharacterized protein [Drosophila tropicalis]|uniref:uncharacterized protein n=1 Tax=Drosophila tropicalis TaxID=46794 RepID=UPI0035ABA8C4